jgi:hypothetical protein
VIAGETRTTTYTKLSTIVAVVPTVILETEKAPDVTRTYSDVKYTTITSLCPVTYAPKEDKISNLNAILTS